VRAQRNGRGRKRTKRNERLGEGGHVSSTGTTSPSHGRRHLTAGWASAGLEPKAPGTGDDGRGRLRQQSHSSAQRVCHSRQDKSCVGGHESGVEGVSGVAWAALAGRWLDTVRSHPPGQTPPDTPLGCQSGQSHWMSRTQPMVTRPGSGRVRQKKAKLAGGTSAQRVVLLANQEGNECCQPESATLQSTQDSCDHGQDISHTGTLTSRREQWCSTVMSSQDSGVPGKNAVAASSLDCHLQNGQG
jgi:hypothetical protein